MPQPTARATPRPVSASAASPLAIRRPASAETAVRTRGRFLAGGTDLVGDVPASPPDPPTLVDIKALPGTAEIRPMRGTWHLGTNVTLAAIAQHPELHRLFPALTAAAEAAASPEVRAVATLGGNLAQHSRCVYYRNPDLSCRKKGGSTCFARDRESRYHSLFTGNQCLSPVCSNLAIACAALGARVVLQRGRRRTSLSIAQLYAEAWRRPTAHHSLRPDDLILGVKLAVVPGQRSAYLQLAEKSDFDGAIVSCAVSATLEQRRLRGVRIALGAVAPVPWVVEAANVFLEGKVPTVELADRAADLMLREARPFGDNGYKIPIARALVRRTLLQLAT